MFPSRVSFAALLAFAFCAVRADTAASDSSSTASALPLSRVPSVCQRLQSSISSNAKVSWPGSTQYAADIAHFLPSSTQNSTCSVEPHTVQDVQTIMRIIGQTRTPYAVKGVGHTSNVGFSSTLGIQIAMSQFNNITYNPSSQTVSVGAGVTWDAVLDVIMPLGRNVAGARAPGVGVAGFTLGGGVSYLLNERGLTIDTLVSLDVVLPTGQFMTVTPSNADLWFAMRGTLDQFGIVTNFVFNTYPQGQIYAGELDFPGSSVNEFNTAVANFFANLNDPKATLIVQYRYLNNALQLETTLFYNAPSPPPGLFDEILAIPGGVGNPSPGVHNFTDVLFMGTPDASGSRFTFNDVEVDSLPKALFDKIANETIRIGQTISPLSSSLNMFLLWANVPSYLTHGPASAWPANRSKFQTSINGWGLWTDASKDQQILSTLAASASRLTADAQELGQNLAGNTLYPNIAPKDTPLSALYGNNVARLRQIKCRYDPHNVTSLTGGFTL